MIYVRKILRII